MGHQLEVVVGAGGQVVDDEGAVLVEASHVVGEVLVGRQRVLVEGVVAVLREAPLQLDVVGAVALLLEVLDFACGREPGLCAPAG